MMRIARISCFIIALFFTDGFLCLDIKNLVHEDTRASVSSEEGLYKRKLQLNGTDTQSTTIGDSVISSVPHLQSYLTTSSWNGTLRIQPTSRPQANRENYKNPPVAKVRSGTYVGYWSVTRLGTSYASFSGIRFAKPMTRENRFQWSEMVEDSPEIFNATEEGPDCPQWNIHRFSNAIVGHEDCLFMNIYSPKVSLDKLYPVMVVIPCGHFAFDSSSRYLNGPDYFMDTKEIVMVIFNYRLGPLGYSDFRSDKYPSNLGMKDQVIALQWVQKNIQGFGGDPNRVTLQGTSSGAVSVHFHYMSPLSKGLFHAGISESGTALDPWSIAYPLKARDLLKSLASKVDCEWALPASPLDSADKLADCFKNRTAYQLLDATRNFNLRLIQTLFLPVIESTKDRPFLPADPFDAPEINLPWLCGQNSDEAGLITPLENPLFLLVRYYLMFLMYSDNAVPHWFNFAETATDPKNVTEAIIRHYGKTYWVDQSHIIPLMKKAGTDGLFSNPLYMSLLKHKGPKYAYRFAYRQTKSDGVFRHPDRGVTHSEEQFYLFLKQGVDIQKNSPPSDANTSTTLVRLWVNFVKHHNPTPDNSGFTKWEEWSRENHTLYYMGQNSTRMMTDPQMDVYKFWKELPYRDKMKPFAFYTDGPNTTHHKNQKSLGQNTYCDISLLASLIITVITLAIR